MHIKKMNKYLFNILGILLSIILCAWGCAPKNNKRIITGAEQTEKYIPLLKNKKVGIVANQTSVINNVHLVDSLIKRDINIVKIFGPEHGFRGNFDAGASINDTIDVKTGLPIISLHGKYKKPQKKNIDDLDVILFDIQDVGVRFYTYASTLQYVMEACAENDKELILLDRPNPNGFYVDGPLLDSTYRTFLGLNPVPIVHGLTLGEMAIMINGENWLNKNLNCKIRVIKCQNYTHSDKYILPVNPSPNLTNMHAIYLYPSLGLLEGTTISAGRGTKHPFEMLGHPKLRIGNYTCTPTSMPGASIHPKFENQECQWIYLGKDSVNHLIISNKINISWLINVYKDLKQQDIQVFNKYFPHHAGTLELQKQIEAGLQENAIRKSWEAGISEYKLTRKKYLLYPDFE